MLDILPIDLACYWLGLLLGPDVLCLRGVSRSLSAGLDSKNRPKMWLRFGWGANYLAGKLGRRLFTLKSIKQLLATTSSLAPHLTSEFRYSLYPINAARAVINNECCPDEHNRCCSSDLLNWLLWHSNVTISDILADLMDSNCLHIVEKHIILAPIGIIMRAMVEACRRGDIRKVQVFMKGFSRLDDSYELRCNLLEAATESGAEVFIYLWKYYRHTFSKKHILFTVNPLLDKAARLNNLGVFKFLTKKIKISRINLCNWYSALMCISGSLGVSIKIKKWVAGRLRMSHEEMRELSDKNMAERLMLRSGDQ